MEDNAQWTMSTRWDILMSFLLCRLTGRDRICRAAAGLPNGRNVQRTSNETTGGDGDTDASRQLWADTDSTGEQWTRSHRWLCLFSPLQIEWMHISHLLLWAVLVLYDDLYMRRRYETLTNCHYQSETTPSVLIILFLGSFICNIGSYLISHHILYVKEVQNDTAFTLWS